MTPEPSRMTLVEAFEDSLRDFGRDDPLADFSLQDATAVVRADRDGRST